VEGPRTDAKAALKKEKTHGTEDNLAAARPGSSKIRRSE
jgi:hypothetical protein